MDSFTLAVILYHLGFIFQELFPAGFNINFFGVFFCQANEHGVVGCFADHQLMVKGCQLIVINIFGKHLEALTAAGFNHRRKQQPVDELSFPATAYDDEFPEFVHIVILALAPKDIAAFKNNVMYAFKMIHFLLYQQGHFLHQFHGSIINKVPLLKKLNLLEVAGGGIMYVPEKNLRYAEMFFGVEKIIRFWRERYKIGGYIVTSLANKFNTNPVQFKIGIEVFNRRKNSWY